jgi:hypothetical protein
MTEPTRDDLLWARPRDGLVVPVSDAEFDAIARQDGWVKLDVDVEALKRGRVAYQRDDHLTAAMNWARPVKAVLDALNPEGSGPVGEERPSEERQTER